MVRRTGYGGFPLVTERFEAMRPAMERLQAMEQAHGRMTPIGAALDHAVLSVRAAANILTQQLEFFGPTPPDDAGRYAQTVAELQTLRPMLDDLNRIALSYHPTSIEARSLRYAADTIKTAANLLSGQRHFFI